MGVGRAHLRPEDLGTQGGEVGLALERQADLLLHEAVEVGVEQGKGRAGRDEREPLRGKATEHGIVVAQVLGAGRAARVHQPHGPAVPQQHRPPGDRPRPQLGPPVAAHDRQVQLAEHRVDHRVEQRLLARDVVVERHRLDAEAAGQRPHRQGGQALLVGEGHRLGDDAVAAQRGAGGRHPGSSGNWSVGWACQILQRKATLADNQSDLRRKEAS